MNAQDILNTLKTAPHTVTFRKANGELRTLIGLPRRKSFFARRLSCRSSNGALTHINRSRWKTLFPWPNSTPTFEDYYHEGFLDIQAIPGSCTRPETTATASPILAYT